MKKAFLI